MTLDPGIAEARRRRSFWRIPTPPPGGPAPLGGAERRGGGAAEADRPHPEEPLPDDVRRARRLYREDREAWRAAIDRA